MIRMLAVIEISGVVDEADATDRLDQFRDDVRPGETHGVTIYRATVADVAAFHLHGALLAFVPARADSD